MWWYYFMKQQLMIERKFNIKCDFTRIIYNMIKSLIVQKKI